MVAVTPAAVAAATKAGGRCGDIDWAKVDAVNYEFLERDRKRQLRYLQRFHAANGMEPPSKDAPLERLPTGSSVRSSALQSRRGGLEGGAALPRLGTSSSLGSRSWLASSAGSTAPPRTGSTTLSSVWRRALSTPSLENGGKCDFTAEQEEWNAASAHMGQEELARLVEHVHARVRRERRRRKQAEAELARRKGGQGDGGVAPLSPAPQAKMAGAP
eukprot:TRINITY_DN10774_c0_g2_i1.p1 TRINITY_DN10774_c0_g2~~TRINITY_DN10774_c0_g2_i1.p1  ORF type:complete len:216 (+),score=65.74 TRINITY_DN10774_c0_g2_i1:137-784(+)